MGDKKEFLINFTNRNEASLMLGVTSIEGFANGGKTLGLIMTMLEDLGNEKYDRVVFVTTEETPRDIIYKANKLCGASSEALEGVDFIEAGAVNAPAALEELLNELSLEEVNYCCYIDNIDAFAHLNKHLKRAANGDPKKVCEYVVREISNYGPLVFTKYVTRGQSMELNERAASKLFTSPTTPPPEHRYICTLDRDSGKLTLNPITDA